MEAGAFILYSIRHQMEAGTGLCRQEVSDLFFGIGEGGSYGFGAVLVVVVIRAE